MNIVEQINALLPRDAWQAYAEASLYQELLTVLVAIGASYLCGRLVSRWLMLAQSDQADSALKPLKALMARFSQIIYPASALVLLKLSVLWLSDASATPLVAIFYLLVSVLLVVGLINLLVVNVAAKRVALIFGVALVALKSLGFFDDIIAALDAMAFRSGHIRISVYDGLRVMVVGVLLFWLGRLSNATGKKIIRNQSKLDSRSKELFSKLFEIGVFTLAVLLLLQVMGINLTTLAVFGGALGVGLGFGLQSIASNFISGVIILVDRSVSLDDFIELDDGRSGRVTELSLRATTLETYDGKDIVVPNETFITSSFINWTHKDNKQRYRVDFSVAYHTDVRKLVDVVKQAVGEHPQVIDGEKIPIEERPDCEIDSFGDSGINMFVEFWMEGIDDGKNRVGGDLLLIILETIREHGYEIPFPQREVRILNGPVKVSP